MIFHIHRLNLQTRGHSENCSSKYNYYSTDGEFLYKETKYEDINSVERKSGDEEKIFL